MAALRPPSLGLSLALLLHWISFASSIEALPISNSADYLIPLPPTDGKSENEYFLLHKLFPLLSFSLSRTHAVTLIYAHALHFSLLPSVTVSADYTHILYWTPFGVDWRGGGGPSEKGAHESSPGINTHAYAEGTLHRCTRVNLGTFHREVAQSPGRFEQEWLGCSE